VGDAIDSKELDKIVDFYNKYLAVIDRETVKEQILKHLEYGTIDYAINDVGEVIGLCCWNITDEGKTARIRYIAVEERWRKQGLGKHFLARGLKLWKNVTHIEFDREFKKNGRTRKIPIGCILRHNIF
jgi:N-acetylglutamate synthase-like GNAT family acetyltransferase